ncbi:MAG TPA: hypothetical protein DCG57_06390 [Candidatus Riflebacteria bacterium]|jgi:tRNA A37 threonylcarbamoyladenosine modification protein TsaB|nr:hypothetical protein [Candidatus Riflebacteria bacterium]
MRYLFIDASENLTGSQYGDDNRFFWRNFDTDRNIGARISEICDCMLAEAGCSLADIDLLAVCTGPGSLTGLRVAAGFFRTLAFIGGKPITGIDVFRWSLKTLQMQNVSSEVTLVLPTLIDKAFVVSANVGDPDLNYNPPTLCARDSVSGPQLLSIKCDLPGMSRVDPSSEALHSLLLNRAATSNFDDILGVLPMYVIPSQAERKLEEQK